MEIKNYESLNYKVIAVDLINENKLQKIYSEVDKVMKDMNQKRKEKGLKERKIRALILGIPNVGKSTLIGTL